MQPLPTLPEWVTLEHRVAQILQEQEEHGWYFNEQLARELESTLRRELRDLTQVLSDRFPYVPGNLFTPKRDLRTRGYVAGAEFQKLKDFNPSSREHIAWILQQNDGWKPSEKTATGKPMVDETTLKNHGTGLALQFLRILEITKSLGMMSEGANAWLKLSTSANRIHHHCSTATSTFRCAHRNPNLAQVPSGDAFRQLFTATPGMVMVAADLAGIELRMLSHYLARWDEGRYRDILLNGDIHQVNADKIGISRKLVKTVTYAFLYGAGDQKIGLSYDKQLTPKSAISKGKEIRAAYIDAIPGLADLLSSIKDASGRGYVKAIDGRKVSLDSPHKALNYLLQGSAAVVAKRWLLLTRNGSRTLCCSQLAFIHDELQYESDPDHSEQLKDLLECSALAAGQYYNLRCPVQAEGKIGANWAETH